MQPAVITREQARELDRRAAEEFGLPGLVLMENAGRGVAETVRDLGIAGPVAIFCGAGNNGGDGFVAARHLDLHGMEVRIVLCTPPHKLRGDALVNYRVAERSGLSITGGGSEAELTAEAQRAAVIVDALLGTGSQGNPRPPLDRAIDAINAAAARGIPVVAVDIPSGLDCETGLPSRHTVRAAHTCTFVAAKPGFFAPAAAEFIGQVHIIDIGAPRKLVEEVVNRG